MAMRESMSIFSCFPHTSLSESGRIWELFQSRRCSFLIPVWPIDTFFPDRCNAVQWRLNIWERIQSTAPVPPERNWTQFRWVTSPVLFSVVLIIRSVSILPSCYNSCSCFTPLRTYSNIQWRSVVLLHFLPSPTILLYPRDRFIQALSPILSLPFLSIDSHSLSCSGELPSILQIPWLQKFSGLSASLNVCFRWCWTITHVGDLRRSALVISWKVFRPDNFLLIPFSFLCYNGTH